MATKKRASKKADPKEVRIKPDLSKYQSGRAASGSVTKNCGDFVAELVNGFTLDEVYSLVAKVRDDVTVADLQARYAGLKNDGLRIMNARNLLRKVANADGGQATLNKAAASTRKLADNRAIKATKEREARAAERAAKAKEKKAKKKAA